MMMERRFTSGAGAEVRAKGDDKKPGIEGYAAVFGEDYVLYDSKSFKMIERIKKGAFTRALEEEQDVRCLFNHEPDNLLARTANGTLRMSQNDKGLLYDVDLDSRTRVAADVRCFVDRKDVTGCSFSFIVRKQTWTETEDNGFTLYVREVEDLDLFDVGPVTYPAYEGTCVGARASCSNLARELRSAWAEGIPAEIRSKLDVRAKAKDDDEECDCRCVACKRDKDCSKCTDHMVDCGDEANCDHSRSSVPAVELAVSRSKTEAEVDERMRRAGLKAS